MKKPIIVILADIKKEDQEKFLVNTYYVKAIEKAGGFPVILPYNKNYNSFLKKTQGILLTGGGLYEKKKKHIGKPLKQTNPKRYGYENIIINYAIKNKIPLMGICRGAEMICEVLDGKVENKVVASIEKNHRNTKHVIRVFEDTLLYKTFKSRTIKVNSFHSKIIAALPEKLMLSAVSTKDGVIEAFESEDGTILGVQFHPERLLNKKPFRNLFLSFVKLAKLQSTKKLKRSRVMNKY